MSRSAQEKKSKGRLSKRSVDFMQQVYRSTYALFKSKTFTVPFFHLSSHSLFPFSTPPTPSIPSPTASMRPVLPEHPLPSRYCPIEYAFKLSHNSSNPNLLRPFLSSSPTSIIAASLPTARMDHEGRRTRSGQRSSWQSYHL